jgi:hypothetical protein
MLQNAQLNEQNILVIRQPGQKKGQQEYWRK